MQRCFIDVGVPGGGTERCENKALSLPTLHNSRLFKGPFRVGVREAPGLAGTTVHGSYDRDVW